MSQEKYAGKKRPNDADANDENAKRYKQSESPDPELNDMLAQEEVILDGEELTEAELIELAELLSGNQIVESLAVCLGENISFEVILNFILALNHTSVNYLHFVVASEIVWPGGILTQIGNFLASNQHELTQLGFCAYLNDNQALQILNYIVNGDQISTLDLTGNNISEEGGEAILNYLHENNVVLNSLALPEGISENLRNQIEQAIQGNQTPNPTP